MTAPGAAGGSCSLAMAAAAAAEHIAGFAYLWKCTTGSLRTFSSPARGGVCSCIIIHGSKQDPRNYPSRSLNTMSHLRQTPFCPRPYSPQIMIVLQAGNFLQPKLSHCLTRLDSEDHAKTKGKEYVQWHSTPQNEEQKAEGRKPHKIDDYLIILPQSTLL